MENHSISLVYPTIDSGLLGRYKSEHLVQPGPGRVTLLIERRAVVLSIALVIKLAIAGIFTCVVGGVLHAQPVGLNLYEMTEYFSPLEAHQKFSEIKSRVSGETQRLLGLPQPPIGTSAWMLAAQQIHSLEAFCECRPMVAFNSPTWFGYSAFGGPVIALTNQMWCGPDPGLPPYMDIAVIIHEGTHFRQRVYPWIRQLPPPPDPVPDPDPNPGETAWIHAQQKLYIEYVESLWAMSQEPEAFEAEKAYLVGLVPSNQLTSLQCCSILSDRLKDLGAYARAADELLRSLGNLDKGPHPAGPAHNVDGYETANSLYGELVNSNTNDFFRVIEDYLMCISTLCPGGPPGSILPR